MEFFQRRGRILRQADGKDKSFIYDFIVLPPPGQNCAYVKREVKRLIEMGKDCSNKSQTREMLSFILENYEIKDEEISNIAYKFCTG